MKFFHIILLSLVSVQLIFVLVSGKKDESGDEPCGKTDTVCWAEKSNEYTNRLRAELNIPAVSLGTEYMLDNAVEYSKELDGTKVLEHQPIAEGGGVFVGTGTDCEVQLVGENLAWFNDPSVTNYAWQCVMVQWRNSKGHYENIKTERFKASITGIYVGSDGRVTCTQTFVQKTFSGLAGKCKNVRRETAVAPTPSTSPSTSTSTATEDDPALGTGDDSLTPSPTPMPTTTPSPSPTISDASDVSPEPACAKYKVKTLGIYNITFVNNECRYCNVPSGGMYSCFGAADSEYLNDIFTGTTFAEATTNTACAGFTSRNIGVFAVKFVNNECRYCNSDNQCFRASDSTYLDNIFNNKS